MAAASESPPSAKKSSVVPTASSPRTFSQMRSSWSSSRSSGSAFELPDCIRSAALRRRVTRSILPEGRRGSSFRVRNRLGTECGGNCFRSLSRSDCSGQGVVSHERKAARLFIPCPPWTAIAATSRTPGTRISADSISAGFNHRPRIFITSSARPKCSKLPSGRKRPRSLVVKILVPGARGSIRNFSAVASGHSQYPCRK